MEKTRRSLSLFGFLIFFLLISSNLWSQINLQVEDLEFDDSVGLSEIHQAMIDQNLEYMMDDVELLVFDMLNKPILTGNISLAQTLTSVVPMHTSPMDSQRGYLATGADVSLIAPVYDKDKLVQYAESLDVEDDPYLGAGAQLFRGEWGIPLERIVPRLSLQIAGGFFAHKQELFSLTNHKALLSFSYRPINNRALGSQILWTPLALQTGAGYQYIEVLVDIDPGVMVQSFALDPDGGDLPFPPQTLSFEITPKFQAGLHTGSITWPFSMGMGFRFFDLLELNLGGGLLTAWSWTEISLEGSGTVSPVGYLGDLLNNTPRVTAEGTQSGEPGPLFSPYLWTNLRVDMNSLYLSVPLLYQPGSGLASGFSLGVQW